ncbi:MAG: glycine betaine ABC transporter substrate-binding protein [Planctomycetes bacterium]|nr:glycine betaine ABC transporter substrate-binding protein [Planctomycetota bacterium]
MKNAALPLLVLILLVGGYVGYKFYADADRADVTLAYVEWDSEVASTNVVRFVLQEKMGLKVEILAVSAPAMWQSIAKGEADGMVAAWLPTLHADLLESTKDSVVDLGPNLKGTLSGLVVPGYVDCVSIEDLRGRAEEFDGRIIGIEPGAGIMKATERVIANYGLEGFQLISGSSATMTKELETRIRYEKPVVVTGWTPHWMFSRFELKYLIDSKNEYGGEEEIHTIVRKGLEDDMPKVYAFLDKFEWTTDDMSYCMRMIQEGEEPYDAANLWVAKNEDKVRKWLE